MSLRSAVIQMKCFSVFRNFFGGEQKILLEFSDVVIYLSYYKTNEFRGKKKERDWRFQKRYGA